MRRITIFMLLMFCVLGLHAQDVITKQPEGELKNLYRSSDAYYLSGEYVYRSHIDGVAAYVVEASDGCYYVKNPYSTLTLG